MESIAMTKSAAGPIIVIGLLFGLGALSAQGQSELIYSSNFELEFTIGKASYSVQNHARVRDGSAIPIELGNYRVEIGITETTLGHYQVDLRVLEKSKDSWLEMNLDGTSFSGDDSVPVEFEWNDADIGINLAFVASGARQ